MDKVFYLNDSYPLTANVFAPDGVTPVLAESAEIDVLNQITGQTIVTAGSCVVASGLATYFVLSGTTLSLTPGIYVGYMRVKFDGNTAQTIAIPFDVLDKKSYLTVDRWRAKVEDSAPSEDHISDEHGREWVDQAVNYLSRQMDLPYTSLLGALDPMPTTNDMEFIASVASLMARFSWWAGKGNYKDNEISYFGTPFEKEWTNLEEQIEKLTAEDWFSEPLGGDVYNRDKVYWDGRKLDSPAYWHRDSTDVVPNTEIPI